MTHPKSKRPEPPETDAVEEPAAAALPGTPAEEEAVPAGQTAEPAAAAAEPDYKDRWLRAEAELQNFRRRALREMDESRRAAEERVILEMLNLLDDLERALAAARAAGAPESWTRGVTLAINRALDYLARQGVQPVDPLGQPFDPELHEALFEAEAADRAPGTVMQVLDRGYRRGERALRAARVVVARAPAEGGD